MFMQEEILVSYKKSREKEFQTSFQKGKNKPRKKRKENYFKMNLFCLDLSKWFVWGGGGWGGGVMNLIVVYFYYSDKKKLV